MKICTLKTICVLMVLILFASLTSCGNINIDTEKGISWKSPFGGIYNTNSSQFGLKEPMAVTWEQNLGKPTKCSPVSAGGVTIISDLDGMVYCFNNEDGNKIWTRQFIGGTIIQPVISKNKALFADGSSTFYSINISDGSQAWQQNIPAPLVGWALTDSGKIYLAAGNSLVCFEETKGTQIFRKDVNLEFSAAPSLQKYLYIPAGKTLLAVNPETGETVWQVNFERPIIGTVACMIGSVIVVDGNVYVLDDKDGKVIYMDEKESFEIGDGRKLEYWYCTPASYYINLILCSTTKPTMLGFQSSPLKKAWIFGTMSKMEKPPFISGKRIIFASDLRLYVCDASNGSWKWHYNYNENITGICPVGVDINHPIDAGEPKMCLITAGDKGKIMRFDEGGKPLTKDEIKQLPDEYEKQMKEYEETLKKQQDKDKNP